VDRIKESRLVVLDVGHLPEEKLVHKLFAPVTFLCSFLNRILQALHRDCIHKYTLLKSTKTKN
jgi:hypothetical protein